MEHNRPGNVREFKNAVERALVTCCSHTLNEGNFAFLAHHVAVKPW